ncbi:MAG: hypothetical protein K8S18_01130, partial [Desulfobacula sp.]|nr:hypothetical protein [Desulfobacula sp.]
NDLFDIKTEKIEFRGLNLYELEFNKQIYLNALNIFKPEIQIYRDKRLPDPPFKHKAMIAGLLQKIPFEVRIDTLNLKNGKLVYEEMFDLTDQPGEVHFNPLFITANNITNSRELTDKNPILPIHFKGKIMGSAWLEANLFIDLSVSNEVFTINGTLDPTTASIFNPMVQPILLARLDRGDVHKTSFNFSANNDLSQGELILEYEDLYIEVLNEKRKNRIHGGLTFFTNQVIRHKNIKTKRNYIVGQIYFERDQNKGLPNFLWKSIKTGLVSIVAPVAAKKVKKEKKERKPFWKKKK